MYPILFLIIFIGPGAPHLHNKTLCVIPAQHDVFNTDVSWMS